MLNMTDVGKRNLLNALDAFEEVVVKDDPVTRTSDPVDAFLLDAATLEQPPAPGFFALPLLDLAGLRVLDAQADSYDTFYEREDVTELWTLIDSLPHKKVLSIQGQPGTGKSSALWRKVLEMAVSGDNVLWISLDRDGAPVSIVYFQGGWYAQFQMKLSTVRELEIFMHHKAIPLNTVVVDGCSAETKYLTTGVRLWAKQRGTSAQSRAIFTSSTKVERLRSHQNDHVAYHVVNSWTRNQFKAALYSNDGGTTIWNACAPLFYRDYGLVGNSNNDGDDIEDSDEGDEPSHTIGSNTEDGKPSPNEMLLSCATETDDGAKHDDLHPPPVKKAKVLSDEDVEDLVQGRYDYSGGSARWMFNYTKQQIEKELRSYCDNAENRQSILNGDIGPTSKAATNYFFGSSKRSDGDPEYFLVSKRAVEILSEKTAGSSFETLYRFADSLENPSFVGWIVEADFFHQLDKARTESAEFRPRSLSARGAAFKPEAIHEWEHTCNKNRLLILDSKTARTKTKKAEEKRISGIVSKLITKIRGNSIVCKPTTWNQGGYDAFFVECVGDGILSLRFVQVTKGVSHDLKAEYMYSATMFFERAGFLVESIEIAFLLTPKNSSSFSLDAVNGIGFLSKYQVYGKGKVKWTGVEDISSYELTLSRK